MTIKFAPLCQTQLEFNVHAMPGAAEIRRWEGPGHSQQRGWVARGQAEAANDVDDAPHPQPPIITKLASVWGPEPGVYVLHSKKNEGYIRYLSDK